MALITGVTLIRSISVFHLTIAYYLLTAPYQLADQNLVFIFGESMGVPHSSAFDRPSAPSSFLAAVLGFLAVSDLLATSLPEDIGHYHWGNQAPVRLLLFFALTGYSLFMKDVTGSVEKSRSHEGQLAGDGLRNSLVLTWSFLEMIIWFWIYVTLRDERREAAAKVQMKKRMEQDCL